MITDLNGMGTKCMEAAAWRDALPKTDVLIRCALEPMCASLARLLSSLLLLLPPLLLVFFSPGQGNYLSTKKVVLDLSL